jgi:nitroreductase
MILETMQSRRSVRRFLPEQVLEETLLELIEAAVTAPSAGNSQPWRFLIVREKAIIESAADLVDKERYRLKGLLRTEFQNEVLSYSVHFSHFRSAPHLVVPLFRVVAGMTAMLQEETPEEERASFQALDHHSALLSVSLAIQNILLRAEELGLGACCMTGPLLARKPLERCLGVPEGWQIAALIPIGLPGESPFNPGRKPVRSFVRWL